MVISYEDMASDIMKRMSEAVSRSGRKVSDVTLMAVTKTRSPKEIIDMTKSTGISLYGENRVQEAQPKIGAWSSGIKSEWHLIGHLQRNKARKALELFSMIQSLDSVRLAETLHRLCEEKDMSIEVLIEVNTSGEDSKHGIIPEETEKFADHILENCQTLKLKGLMTVGPLDADEIRVRQAFRLLREKRELISGNCGLELPVLSMGMSGDFEWAIEEGSTMIRVGTGLFGARSY